MSFTVIQYHYNSGLYLKGFRRKEARVARIANRILLGRFKGIDHLKELGRQTREQSED